MNVTINTKDLNEMIKGFREKAPELICKASILAHRKLAKQAAGRLKGGLAIFGGVRGSPDYKTSKNFEMPLAHTFNLYDSIGYRVIGSPGEQTSMVGANIDGESFISFLDSDGVQVCSQLVGFSINAKSENAFSVNSEYDKVKPVSAKLVTIKITGIETAEQSGIEVSDYKFGLGEKPFVSCKLTNTTNLKLAANMIVVYKDDYANELGSTFLMQIVEPKKTIDFKYDGFSKLPLDTAKIELQDTGVMEVEEIE